MPPEYWRWTLAINWCDPENGHKTFYCHQCLMDEQPRERAELIHLIHSEHITHGAGGRPESRLYFRCERGHSTLYAITNDAGRTAIHFAFDLAPRGTK